MSAALGLGTSGSAPTDERQGPMATMDVRSNRVALAAGMVSAQADCTIDEALLRMQEHASRRNQTLEEVAIQIVARVVCFGDR